MAVSAPAQQLRRIQLGDHKGVLRIWSTKLKHEAVPGWHLAQIVESMRGLKLHGNTIVEDLRDHLPKHSAGVLPIVNEMLATLSKSLDAHVVKGVFEILPALGVKPDSSM